jgi:hypothetical protein
VIERTSLSIHSSSGGGPITYQIPSNLIVAANYQLRIESNGHATPPFALFPSSFIHVIGMARHIECNHMVTRSITTPPPMIAVLSNRLDRLLTQGCLASMASHAGLQLVLQPLLKPIRECGQQPNWSVLHQLDHVLPIPNSVRVRILTILEDMFGRHDGVLSLVIEYAYTVAHIPPPSLLNHMRYTSSPFARTPLDRRELSFTLQHIPSPMIRQRTIDDDPAHVGAGGAAAPSRRATFFMGITLFDDGTCQHDMRVGVYTLVPLLSLPDVPLTRRLLPLVTHVHAVLKQLQTALNVSRENRRLQRIRNERLAAEQKAATIASTSTTVPDGVNDNKASSTIISDAEAVVAARLADWKVEEREETWRRRLEEEHLEPLCRAVMLHDINRVADVVTDIYDRYDDHKQAMIAASSKDTIGGDRRLSDDYDHDHDIVTRSAHRVQSIAQMACDSLQKLTVDASDMLTKLNLQNNGNSTNNNDDTKRTHDLEPTSISLTLAPPVGGMTCEIQPDVYRQVYGWRLRLHIYDGVHWRSTILDMDASMNGLVTPNTPTPTVAVDDKDVSTLMSLSSSPTPESKQPVPPSSTSAQSATCRMRLYRALVPSSTPIVDAPPHAPLLVGECTHCAICNESRKRRSDGDKSNGVPSDWIDIDATLTPSTGGTSTFIDNNEPPSSSSTSLSASSSVTTASNIPALVSPTMSSHCDVPFQCTIVTGQSWPILYGDYVPPCFGLLAHDTLGPALRP